VERGAAHGVGSWRRECPSEGEERTRNAFRAENVDMSTWARSHSTCPHFSGIIRLKTQLLVYRGVEVGRIRFVDGQREAEPAEELPEDRKDRRATSAAWMRRTHIARRPSVQPIAIRVEHGVPGTQSPDPNPRRETCSVDGGGTGRVASGARGPTAGDRGVAPNRRQAEFGNRFPADSWAAFVCPANVDRRAI